MNNISILKIESGAKSVLVSKNATQKVMPKTKLEVFRNVNFEPIFCDRRTKLRSVIETTDIPNFDLINYVGVLKIYSIITFRQDSVLVPTIDYVKDSVVEGNGYITFRPVLNMLLTDFACKNDCESDPVWRFEFEEK